jgi:hypothetical protein
MKCRTEQATLSPRFRRRLGNPLPDMPLIVEPDGAVAAPLEETYVRAFSVVPRRWRRVLEAAG